MVGCSFALAIIVGILGYLEMLGYLPPAQSSLETTFQIAKISALVGCLSFLILWPVYNYHLRPKTLAEKEKLFNWLTGICEIHQNHPFYLKEYTSEMGIRGELKGNFGGGFLWVSGKIYGSIDSGRVLTAVYYDDDEVLDDYAGVHRSISLPLDEVIIETISLTKPPYFHYPEAQLTEGDFDNKWHLSPGRPHLCLPKGWKIL